MALVVISYVIPDANLPLTTSPLSLTTASNLASLATRVTEIDVSGFADDGKTNPQE